MSRQKSQTQNYFKNRNRNDSGASSSKSIKMGLDDLKSLIAEETEKALRKNEEADAFEKGRKDDTVNVADIIEEALELVEEKRKSRKEDGEDLGEITTEEIVEAVQEVMEGYVEDESFKDDDDPDNEDKDDQEDEGKDDDEDKDNDEEKRRGKARQTSRQAKQRLSRQPAVAERKYSNIYLNLGSGGAGKGGQKKKLSPHIQLARAVKCLDVFGRHDPEAAAYYAKKHYDDADMSREFKALSATSPTGGGYLIPEVYLNEIIELLYAKTVFFELGAQKLPMPNGNLNVPKMTSGARASWGGEARKIKTSQPTFGSLKLFSKRLEAIVAQTRELMMSTNYSADQMFANDLTRRMQLGIDWGGMFGSGNEFQPTGITKTKGVEKIDAKTIGNEFADNQGRVTADFPIFVRSKVLEKNVDDLHLGWTFNSAMEGHYMNLKTTTGAYIYRDEMNTGKFAGFPYKVSNQIPTTQDGYTESIFGNWADAIVGEQMGLETYTTLDGSWTDEDGVVHNAFEENLAGTRALMYVDVGVRHAESFVHIVNLKVR